MLWYNRSIVCIVIRQAFWYDLISEDILLIIFMNHKLRVFITFHSSLSEDSWWWNNVATRKKVAVRQEVEKSTVSLP
jgi:hypothetical protein